MKRSNVAISSVCLALAVATLTITFARPAWLAGYARLLSLSAWRKLEAVCLLVLFGTTAAAVIRQRRTRPARRG